ncbi:substrate-binding domain-containing protein [Pseudomonas thivervalensis]|uniref:substrate-binding domain-containing protein n=1 Tax=Pseudomonas thivervalensis TaxID=86265 RepID=UPI003CED4BEF
MPSHCARGLLCGSDACSRRRRLDFQGDRVILIAGKPCSQLEKGYQDIIFQTDILRLDSVRNALLTRYPMHWVVRTGSAYDRAYGSLEDLSQERIVTFSRNSRPHQDILNLLHSANIVSPRINCVNSASVITRLVSDGFGIGAMPAALVVGELAQGTLTLVDGCRCPRSWTSSPVGGPAPAWSGWKTSSA